jgi:hypothetical protein
VLVQVAAAVEGTVAVEEEADVGEAAVAVEEGMEVVEEGMAAAGEVEAVGSVAAGEAEAAAGVDAKATGFALMRGLFPIACSSSSISARLD